MATIAVAVRYASNMAEWTTNLRQGLNQIEATTAGADRLAKALSGDKLIAAANNAAAAIERMGGVSRLTSAEQEKWLPLLDKAIEKYRVLGKDPPSAMVQLADSMRPVTQQLSVMEQAQQRFHQQAGMAIGRVKEMALGFISAQAVIGAFQTAWHTMVQFVGDSIREFLAADKASRSLQAALQAQGAALPEVIAHYDALAEKYAALTIHEDDALRATEALLVTVGGVLPTEMDKALQAVTNLATRTGSLESAAVLVAKAFEDNFTALGRAGVQIDATRAKAEGMTYVLDAINDKFGGQAQAEMESYAGQLQKIENDYNNLKESLGQVLVTSGAWNDVMTLLKLAMVAVRLEIEYFAASVRTVNAAVEILLSTTFAWLRLAPTVKEVTDEFSKGPQAALKYAALLHGKTLEQSEAVKELERQLRAQAAAQEAAAKAAREHAENMKKTVHWNGDLKEMAASLVRLEVAAQGLRDAQERAWSPRILAMVESLNEVTFEFGNRVEDLNSDWVDFGIDWGSTLRQMVASLKPLVMNFEEWERLMKSLESRTAATNNPLKDTVDLFVQLGQIGATSFGSAMRNIGQVLAGLNQLRTATNLASAAVSSLTAAWAAYAVAVQVSDWMNDLRSVSATTLRIRQLTEAIHALGAAQTFLEMHPGLGRRYDVIKILELQLQLLQQAQFPWQEMEEAAERYGISIDALGRQFAAAKFLDPLRQMVKDWELLTKHGADANVVAMGMKERLQAAVVEALKFGYAMPEGLKKVIQRLVEMGELTDENGQKLENIERLTWTKTLEQSLEELIEEFKKLVEVLGRAIPRAAEDAARSIRSLPRLPGGTGGGGGGAGPRDGEVFGFGSGVSITLAAGSVVFNGGLGSGAGTGDARAAARMVSREILREAQLRLRVR